MGLIDVKWRCLISLTKVAANQSDVHVPDLVGLWSSRGHVFNLPSVLFLSPPFQLLILCGREKT